MTARPGIRLPPPGEMTPKQRLRWLVETLIDCGEEVTADRVSFLFRRETGRPPFPPDLEEVLR